jgi:hypothetical protein
METSITDRLQKNINEWYEGEGREAEKLEELYAQFRNLEAARRELAEALEPFALWADSMQVLSDDQKVCGIEVRHFRRAAAILRASQARSLR